MSKITDYLDQLKNEYDSRPLIKFKWSMLMKLMPKLILVVLCASFIAYLTLDLQMLATKVGISFAGFLTAAMGILLVFRNNTAYDRWWEGRKIWGTLVNTSRHMAMLIKELFKNSPHRLEDFTGLLSAFPHVLKDHLRNRDDEEAYNFLSDEEFAFVKKMDHKPNALIMLMQQRFREAYSSGEITDYQFVKLTDQAGLLTDYLGKCERIKNTPIASGHQFLVTSIAWLYLLTLPFGLVESMGWYSVFVVFFIAYLLLSMIEVSLEIEDPFGTDTNDLPTDKLADMIALNVGEILLGKD
ncbi:bestrophin family ion channel [Mangrovivirga sp. M17]|uniref:Bestrophin family ion channel n=1 Tax=Mangrovivirga halotolerans TaxID=2993936 RepID=A0ABT3RPT9_9BACT|nr:bestrophin family ion channel [Mangrovivirga halotolerans]MCX2743625.1 bestrophin family ion channel [Mangrovivirga halotolerans]